VPLSHRTEVIAHRGASAHAPENTLKSFVLAMRLGADCLELDVRASADGVPVVIHDPTLQRTTGINRAVASTTAAELRALPADHRPPTLEDVLDVFGRDMDYLVEIKRIPVEIEGVVLDCIAERDLQGHVTVQSFDHLLLRRLRHRDRELPLAALFRPGADVRGGLGLVAPFVDGIGPPAGHVDEDLMRAARAHRLAVRAWTVNEPAEMRRLLTAGVDGIITDRPERARAVIGTAVPVAGAASAEAQARMAATSPA
jgi:glycerophosphoryl diester phosphodiesterase